MGTVVFDNNTTITVNGPLSVTGAGASFFCDGTFEVGSAGAIFDQDLTVNGILNASNGITLGNDLNAIAANFAGNVTMNGSLLTVNCPSSTFNDVGCSTLGTTGIALIGGSLSVNGDTYTNGNTTCQSNLIYYGTVTTGNNPGVQIADPQGHIAPYFPSTMPYPTAYTGAGAGTSGVPTATVDPTSSDNSGDISITTSNSPAANSDVFTLTFQAAFGLFSNAPRVILQATNANAQLANVVINKASTLSDRFTVMSTGTPLAAFTKFIWGWKKNKKIFLF